MVDRKIPVKLVLWLIIAFLFPFSVLIEPVFADGRMASGEWIKATCKWLDGVNCAPVAGYHGANVGYDEGFSVTVKGLETGRWVRILGLSSLIRTDDGYIQVGEVVIPSEVLASLVKTKQKWDSTYSVKATMWMYYNEFYADNLTWVKATKYQVRWDVYDSSVSLQPNAAFNYYGCKGPRWPDEQGVSGSGGVTIGSPRSGTIYSLIPDNQCNDYYISMLDFSDWGYQASSTTVRLKRGQSQWSLFVCIEHDDSNFCP